MKALILNSGTGSRMGNLSADKCKCMVEIADGITIIDDQMKRLIKCGINEFCITTGMFAGKLEQYLRSRYPNVRFEFINNPIYDKTNYIYSIYLARELLKCDLLLLHGDLVFETSVLRDILSSKNSSMVVDSTKPLPKKDFKAVIKDNIVTYVGVDVFENALYAQPLYKLLKKDWEIWLDELCRFCENGNTNVYAENALNSISEYTKITSLDIKGRLCFEIDDKNDLSYAKTVYSKM